MSDTAPQSNSSTPRLLNKVKNAFTQSGSAVATTPTPPAQPTPAPAVQPPQPQPVVPTTDQKLEALDKVLTEVEQSVAQQQAQVTQNLVQQSTAPTVPQVSPQQPIQARQQNMGMVAQAAPTAIDQAVYQQQELQAAQAGGAAHKEAVAASAGPAPAEVGASVQYVEQEPTPELSPEVAEYLQHVEDHASQQPQEFVVGEAQQHQPLPTNYQKQAVVVLPITPEVEKQGEKKGPFESVRWLVEWSRKLMKMFSGEIIYREVESQ